MNDNLRIRIRNCGSFVLIMSLWVVWLSPIMTRSARASRLESFNATMGSLCGKLVFLTEAKTGATRLGLRPCVDGDKPYVFSQNPADLYNAYQFKNVTIESGDTFESTEYGKLNKYITAWDSYIQLASCSDCNKGIVVAPTASITPTEQVIATETQAPVITDTPTPTPSNVSLVITNFEADPGNPVLNQRFLLRLTIENRGDPLEATTWDYSGQISLKDANGNEVEAYSFSRDRFSYITQASENGQVVANKWVISIPVSFVHEVDSGRLTVSLLPGDYPISPDMVEAKVTLKPANADMKSCALAVAGKMGGALADDPVLKAAWDAETAVVVAGNCTAEDVGCYATPMVNGLVKTLLTSYPDIRQNAWSGHAPLMSKLLIGLSGIFDVGVLQVCQQPVQWLWKIVEELNRQGLTVNMLGIPPSAIMKISNAQGEITGVLFSGEMVNQIPDSQVIQWSREEYILYPPQEVLITVQGIQDGTLTLQGIMGKGGERVELSYENVAMKDGILAVVNTADSSGDMQVDTNGDGQTDTALHVTGVDVIAQESIQLEPTPTVAGATTTKKPINLPCMSPPAIALPLVGIWLLRRKKSWQTDLQ